MYPNKKLTILMLIIYSKISQIYTSSRKQVIVLKYKEEEEKY
jgi:hypothetical protein